MPLPIFSNYTVIRELGQGGMATVYLATHNTLGHHVAIKILDKQFAYNQNIKARFIEEAKKLVRLDHPNVVKVTDFISENEHVAYVMEYINGKTLRELLNAKRLTDVEVENYLNQMVLALNYIHKEGIVHRDIKPSNFIIATNGTLKLVDFGISKSIDSSSVDHTSTSTNLSMGTLLYMSPEQIKSTKDVTYLSDIYSLGVVIWEMAKGKVPYNTSELSAFDIQVKIVQEKLPKTNTKWDEYIQIATSKEESLRVRFIDLLGLQNSEFKAKKDFNDIEETKIEEVNNKNDSEISSRYRKIRFWIISAILSIIILGIGMFLNTDSDNDGFKDMFDECPNEFGNLNGCLDSDNDKIVDSLDLCPDSYGLKKSNGCPKFESITFVNKNKYNLKFVIAFVDINSKDYQIDGHYEIKPFESFEYPLPKNYSYDKIYLRAFLEDENGTPFVWWGDESEYEFCYSEDNILETYNSICTFPKKGYEEFELNDKNSEYTLYLE
jgi:serine/threonine protein kinase